MLKCNVRAPAHCGANTCFPPRARARHCALLRSGMHRACVRDLIICVELGGLRALARDRGQFV